MPTVIGGIHCVYRVKTLVNLKYINIDFSRYDHSESSAFIYLYMQHE